MVHACKMLGGSSYINGIRQDGVYFFIASRCLNMKTPEDVTKTTMSLVMSDSYGSVIVIGCLQSPNFGNIDKCG